MDSNDIANRFTHHPPKTENRVSDHEFIREECFSLATTLDQYVPEGREKSLALERLEEVMFWANAAIARQDVKPS